MYGLLLLSGFSILQLNIGYCHQEILRKFNHLLLSKTQIFSNRNKLGSSLSFSDAPPLESDPYVCPEVFLPIDFDTNQFFARKEDILSSFHGLQEIDDDNRHKKLHVIIEKEMKSDHKSERDDNQCKYSEHSFQFVVDNEFGVRIEFHNQTLQTCLANDIDWSFACGDFLMLELNIGRS